MTTLLDHIDTMPPDPAAWVAVFEASFTAAENAQEGAAISAVAKALLDSPVRGDIKPCCVTEDARPVAALCLSRLRFRVEPAPVWLMSPVAVQPDLWRSGLGSQLITAAIADLRAQGAGAIVTYGDPGYYARFGFQPTSPSELVPPQPLSMPQGWQAIAFGSGALDGFAGPSTAVPAFDNPDLW